MRVSEKHLKHLHSLNNINKIMVDFPFNRTKLVLCQEKMNFIVINSEIYNYLETAVV